jgi:hypothetical protein
MKSVKQGTFHYKIISLLGVLILRSFDFLVKLTTKNTALYESEKYGFTKLLESKKDIILEEYDNVKTTTALAQVKDFYKVEKDIGQDNLWGGFPIVIYNYLFKENAAMCPVTYQTINHIPGCTAAMFSVLSPGKHILPHSGIYKGIIRGLFTIKVSNDKKCWISINKNKIYFKEGECILFDETYEHEVVNDSNEDRIVLYFDIYRKLPFPLNAFNNLIFHLLKKSPFIGNIPLNYQAIENITIGEHTNLTKPIAF